MISFISRLPNDAEMKEKWVASIKNATGTQLASSHLICSSHFTSDDIKQTKNRWRLADDAIPSLFAAQNTQKYSNSSILSNSIEYSVDNEVIEQNIAQNCSNCFHFESEKKKLLEEKLNLEIKQIKSNYTISQLKETNRKNAIEICALRKQIATSKELIQKLESSSILVSSETVRNVFCV